MRHEKTYENSEDGILTQQKGRKKCEDDCMRTRTRCVRTAKSTYVNSANGIVQIAKLRTFHVENDNCKVANENS